MAHVIFRAVTDDVEPLVREFIVKLEAEGHGGTISRDGEQEPAFDPFAGQDVDKIPQEHLARFGISREEVRRGREMRPAVDVHTATKTADAPVPAPATP